MRKFPFIRLPKIDVRKFLCLIGLHKWAYTDNTHRHCTCCPARQIADVDLDFNTIDWFRVD